jgi:polyphosphate kinase
VSARCVPAIKDLSENIRVRSVIGRFLEHHRIFYFPWPTARQNIYLSSADWMERNFFRRIEISFPVLEPKLKQRVTQGGSQALPEPTTARPGK